MSTEIASEALAEVINSFGVPPKSNLVIRASAEVTADDMYRCEVTARKHTIVIDEPRALLGSNEGQSPVEVVLSALLACQAITYRVWADKLGVTLDKVTLSGEGDIDLQGYYGTDDSVRAGYGAVRINVSLEGPETRERYRELADVVDRHCPVLDIVSGTVPVERTLVEPAAS